LDGHVIPVDQIVNALDSGTRLIFGSSVEGILFCSLPMWTKHSCQGEDRPSIVDTCYQVLGNSLNCQHPAAFFYTMSCYDPTHRK
jgi:hypothetical protein